MFLSDGLRQSKAELAEVYAAHMAESEKELIELGACKEFYELASIRRANTRRKLEEVFTAALADMDSVPEDLAEVKKEVKIDVEEVVAGL